MSFLIRSKNRIIEREKKYWKTEGLLSFGSDIPLKVGKGIELKFFTNKINFRAFASEDKSH